MSIFTRPSGSSSIDDQNISTETTYSSDKIEEQLSEKVSKVTSGEVGEILIKDATGNAIASGKNVGSFAPANHGHNASSMTIDITNFGGVLNSSITTLQYLADFIDDNIGLGKSLEFDWNGTNLGIRQEGGEYEYVNLKGDIGKGLEFSWNGTQLGVRIVGQTSYTYVDLKGATGDNGVDGVDGSDGKGLEFVWDGTVLGVAKEGGDYIYRELKGDKGDNAPLYQIEYSINGTTLWHSPFELGDKFQRVSNDGGATWSEGMRFVGEGAGDMLMEDNLAGLADYQEARDNLGLGNVDNTSDINKPVSTAQAAADTVVLNTAKSYADGLVVGLLDDRGSYDASSNTFPTTGGSGTAGAILKGDMWFISVAGTLGGQSVTVGDSIRALVDAPGQTATNWSIIEVNINYVPENVSNKVTDVDSNKTSNTLYASVKAIYDWVVGLLDTKDNLAITDTRGANRPPSYYDIKKVQWDFVAEWDVGLAGLGETWIALQTIKKWDSHHSSHKIYQFAYAGGLVSMRESTSDADWSAWWQIVDTKSNQSIGGVKDFTGVMKFAEAEWSGSYGVNIKFRNQGNQGFKVRNYNDEIVLEATEGGQVKTKNNHIVLYSDAPRIPRFEVTAKSDDNTKMRWVHYYDRDGAVVGTDTYQIWAYPENSGGAILDYAGVMGLNYNRGNGTCDVNFSRARNLYLNGKSLTSNGSDIFLNTGGDGQTITLRPNGEGNSGNQFEISNNGLYFAGNKLPIGGVIKEIYIGNISNNAAYTIAHGLSISDWEVMDSRYKITLTYRNGTSGTLQGYGNDSASYTGYFGRNNYWSSSASYDESQINWDGTNIRFYSNNQTKTNARLLIYKLF